jgi:hypothetical protein
MAIAPTYIIINIKAIKSTPNKIKRAAELIKAITSQKTE